MKRMILGTSPVAAPFWEATKEKKFLLQFCATTGKAIWYPRDFSPVMSMVPWGVSIR